METNSPNGNKRHEIEAWSNLFQRWIAFVFGMLLIAADLLLVPQATPVVFRGLVLAAGIAMMGKIISSSFAEIVTAMRSGSGE